MANVIQVYQGQLIRTLGVPMIIVTGYSSVSGELRSEYFVFIRDVADSFIYQRFARKYETLPPHPVLDDTKGMMNFAFIMAQEALHDFAVQTLSQKQMSTDFAKVSLVPMDDSVLKMMFLMRDQPRHIESIRNNADSPLLRAFFQQWDQIPLLVEP
jgi:hypothetical protein